MMVMTILEGRVKDENWNALQRGYEEASQDNEPGLVQSFLVQSRRESDLWRIMTLWESREALEAMRATGKTPRGVLIFRQAQSEPQLTIFDVQQTINRQ